MTDPNISVELVDSAAPAKVEPTKGDDKGGAAPSGETKTDTGAAAGENLFELPDGRKVDAATLTKEWKENFLPDYTRKSQKIAEYERAEEPEEISTVLENEDDKPKWAKPDYVPETYAEVIEIATQEALNRIESNARAESERVAAITTQVENQVNDLKKIDPKLDENALFTHANKYGFQDLKAAFQNMSDLKRAVSDTEQKVLKNVKTRDADPIAGTPGGATGADEGGYDRSKVSTFRSAVEYLQSLKGK